MQLKSLLNSMALLRVRLLAADILSKILFARARMHLTKERMFNNYHFKMARCNTDSSLRLHGSFIYPLKFDLFPTGGDLG